jgi:site-specific DNA recombinase
MKKLFGYIRVSTVKQGERGVSLQEQRSAIERYAQRNEIEVCQWFEERVTAAKRGRPMFNEMLKLLRNGRADGIVIHKIDRGARNLKDWSDLGELIDEGVEVRFANESLDLQSRGGRLSADIQAVVAADFIRNLREETRKGFYGRIKQGLYPLPAPIGYLDRGAGQAKQPDPARAPLIRAAFDLYASATCNLDALTEELHRRGLRNRRGGRVSKNGVSRILNNPFYIGIIRLASTNETFPGVHEPLIRKSLFDRVHGVLTGKVNARFHRHDFLYRRLIACRHCGLSLVGETQKSHVYYRCHTKSCPGACVREETVSGEVGRALYPLVLTDAERRCAGAKIELLDANWKADQAAQAKTLELQHNQLNERLAHLTDAYIEKLIDRNLFEERKNALVAQRKDIEENIDALKQEERFLTERLSYILELCGAAYFLHKVSLPEENRSLLGIVTSNRSANDKNVDITLAAPFSEVANRNETSNGAPYRGIPRTIERMIDNLIAWLKANPAATFDAAHDLLADHSLRRDLEQADKRAA